MTNRTPGAPATPVAAAPGVTNPTRKSPRGILQNRERAHASQLGRPTVRRPGPRTPQNLTSRGHLKEGVCPSDLTAAVETDSKRKPTKAYLRSHGTPEANGKDHRRERGRQYHSVYAITFADGGRAGGRAWRGHRSDGGHGASADEHGARAPTAEDSSTDVGGDSDTFGAADGTVDIKCGASDTDEHADPMDGMAACDAGLYRGGPGRFHGQRHRSARADPR